jgi:hypothetical protein
MNIVTRGFAAPAKFDLRLAETVLRGEATLADVMKAFPFDKKHVGVWWHLSGYDGLTKKQAIEEAVEFAYTEGKEETLTTSFGKMLLDELRAGIDQNGFIVKRIEIELPLVLIAKAPRGWSPDLNPAITLMGNSYISEKHAKSVELLSVMYLAGERWVTLPAKGVRAKL